MGGIEVVCGGNQISERRLVDHVTISIQIASIHEGTQTVRTGMNVGDVE
jgi:hypothetical protein